jgi:hypothetical protein
MAATSVAYSPCSRTMAVRARDGINKCGVCRRLLSVGHDGHERFWDKSDPTHLWGYKHGMDIFRALVQGDAIFAGVTNYTVQRWDAKTGVMAWRTFLGGAMRAMDMAVHNGMVYVAVVNCSIFAVDAASGTILWRAIPIYNWTVMVQAHTRRGRPHKLQLRHDRTRREQDGGLEASHAVRMRHERWIPYGGGRLPRRRVEAV